jgi:hypothetical protein
LPSSTSDYLNAMARKTQSNVLRGRGRPKKAVPKVAPLPVANAPAKRGRVAKADVVESPAEPPKKRGRPPKVQTEEVIVVKPLRRGRPPLVAPEPPVEEAPKKRVGRPPKKRMGRPPKAEAEAPAPTPKKRGRPSKANIAAKEHTATPKRRGRPAKNAAVELSRVAGSPRVSKRQIPVKAAPARLNPHLRSKLRTRLAPAQKVVEETATQPAKRRGRPAKATAAPAPAPKKDVKVTKAAVSKSTPLRKKRGFTVVEVPDKFAAQVQQYLQELQEAESLPTPIDDSAEEENVLVFTEEHDNLASATADEEGATVMTEPASEVQEDDFQDEDVEDVVMPEDGEEPIEVDISMSIQEVVQIQQTNEVTTPEQEEEMEEDTELQEDDLSVLAHDDTDAYVTSKPLSGGIFG